MYFVYVLYSFKDKGLYVGCSENTSNRLKKHNAGEVRSTKHRRPLELIHKEEFSNKADAFTRERFLKSLWGGRGKKKILKKYLDQL